MNLPVDYLIRTTLVFALALVVTRMVRRQPAAFRHVIWICAFSIAALTPVLSRFGPRFQFERPAPEIAPALSLAPASEAPPSSPPVTRKQMPFLEIVWIGGMLPFGIRAWNAHRNARALLKNATVVNLSDVPPSIRIAESDAVATPMTLGVFHPWLLLPTEHRLWEAERLRAVLLHELAHVRRRDCLVQWLPNIICAVNWFNPVAWFARSEMLCEGERACDDAVIRSGISGNAFAQDLVDIARSIQLKGNSLMSSALTTKLERRIRRLIDPSADRRALSLGRTAGGAVLALVLLAPVAGVRADQVVKVATVTAVPQVTPEPVPTPAPMKKAPRVIAQVAQPAPATQAAPQPTATGSISGVVSDPTGAVVPNASVQINSRSGDSSTAYRAVTGAVGQWSFNGLAAGDYGLTIQAPGFATFNKTVILNPGANDQGVSHMILGRTSESLTITAQASNASTTSQSRAQSSPKPIRVGGNVQAAKLIHRVDPVFPEAARDKGVQGPVTIQAIIGKDGFIRDTLVSQAPPDLAQAAVDAVRLWQFEPTRLNGEPVEIMTEITVNFQLQ
jgi:TonB family protein